MTNPSKLSDVYLPDDVVELKKLRTKTGEPVRVRIRFLDEIEIYEHLRSIGGDAPQMGPQASPDEMVGAVKRNLSAATGLLEAACYLLDDDGSEVAAFGEGRIPLSRLSVADRGLLFVAVLSCAGLVGGPVDRVRFPDGEAVRADGVGPVGDAQSVEASGASDARVSDAEASDGRELEHSAAT